VRLDHLLSKELVEFLVEDTGFLGRHTVHFSRKAPDSGALFLSRVCLTDKRGANLGEAVRINQIGDSIPRN
jgi:hypothetical protein